MNILKQFDKLKTDQEKWKFVIANQDKGITVMLDNDDTFITVEDSEDIENYGDFDYYIGCSDGVFSLLEAIGVKCEGV